jgi:hypothetical protein
VSDLSFAAVAVLLCSFSSLTARRYGHDHEETARFLVAIGKMHHLLFEFDHAVKCYVRALAIYCDSTGLMNLESAAVCKAMGSSLITLGEIELSVNYRAWALDVFWKCLGCHCETVRALFSFAQSLAEFGDGWYVSPTDILFQRSFCSMTSTLTFYFHFLVKEFSVRVHPVGSSHALRGLQVAVARCFFLLL